jgi:hypothetical protein
MDLRSDNERPLDIPYIKAMILSVLLAAADTIDTAFLAMMTCIMGNSTVYEKMKAQV